MGLLRWKLKSRVEEVLASLGREAGADNAAVASSILEEMAVSSEKVKEKAEQRDMWKALDEELGV